MKKPATQAKFDELYTSYINGNHSWVKAEFKKLSKDDRKECVKYVFAMNDQELNDTTEWFMNLL